MQEDKLTQDDSDHEKNESLSTVSVLLITANVGSLFEDPTRLLQHWLTEFFNKVSQLQPQFLALHLQEVGGKTYEKSMEYVQKFIKSLCDASEMQDFSFIRIYMDEDFKSAEYFTALGNLYFIHKNLTEINLWNFQTHNWEAVEGKCVYSGNIETIATKEKSKFPKHFFPECKWSRKGFMRTRWEINKTVIDLVNIHLFHDASNLAACEEFPSVYCKTRRRALVHTLEKFHLDEKNILAPYFVFGDFNFRCDTEGVIDELTENLTAHRIQSTKSDSTKVHYRNSMGNNVLTIGKKEFNHADHQLKFKESWLKKFDRELEPLKEILIEYPINFCPSYPYEEDPEMPSDYMSTRCPSWCDRILMSPQAKEIILNECPLNSYSIIGENVCMGDHKPIYLNFHLKAHQGTYRCCKCCKNNEQDISTPQHAPPVVGFATKKFAHCPYKSKIYNEIIQECKKLNANNVCAQTNSADSILTEKTSSSNQTANSKSVINNIFKSSQLADEVNGEIIKYPQVSISLIDSDNIHVCVCSHISSRESKAEDNVDGSMCPDCRNIIKRQPVERRHYQLISKRLMLSNDIIVNRIDSQHLNTVSDVVAQEPYTPESAESHSPYPERSSTNSISSRNRSPYEKISVNEEQLIKVGRQTQLIQHVHEDQCGPLLNSQNISFENRGVVSPGQLKSRLEDLQRSSTQSLKHQAQDIDTAGWCCDVETVDATAAVHKRRHNSRLSDCCNII